MNPPTYLEFDSDLQLAACEEWIGREYGRVDCAEWANGAYPIPPYSSPNNPPNPSEYTYKYAQVARKTPAGSGGVIYLDDDILRFATQAQTLSDGSTYTPINFATAAKLASELSAEGQAAIAPPA